MTRIPISGLGVIAPGAIGVDSFRLLLDSGEAVIAEVDRFDTADLGAHRAALVRDFRPRDFINPMKMRRMNNLSRYAVAAAKLALEDAGEKPGENTGVAMGTAFGPVQTSVDYMQEYVEKGAALAPPQLFAESVANAPGSHVAIEWGFRGFNVTVTQRESSALAAAMYAATQLVKGAADAAVIGGVEEVNEMIFSVLDRVGALGEESRPFDARRNGLVPGEGAAAFVASRESDVASRYGYLSGFGIARDVTATISDWGTGDAAVAQAMRAALDDAELAPGDVDAIYASANSTRKADKLEALAIRALFGERVPPVVATKGCFGEYAAGGALQLAAALLAIRHQTLHASAGFEQPDADVTFEVTRAKRSADLRHILVNSISAGGGIVCAVVSREAA